MQNLELQKLETTQLETSEKKFEIARRGKLIRNATEEELRQALRYAMVKIGLRADNFPKGAEKMLLINHVFENFPDSTVDEIRIAFDWGIEGRLDQDINCFENFSCLYFTRIMRSYKRLALIVKTKEQQKKEIVRQVSAPVPEPIEDPEAYDKFMKTGFAQVLKGKGIEIPKW